MATAIIFEAPGSGKTVMAEQRAGQAEDSIDTRKA